MATVTVRITASTHKVLGQLARRSGRSLQATLDEAIESFRRKSLLADANTAFAAAMANPRVGEEERRERDLWDTTLEDIREEGA